MADKWQAVHNFWSSFGLMAYDETSVPDDAQMPYITYTVSTGSLETLVLLSASLWYRSPSWAEISQKADQIQKYLAEMYPPTIELDEGRLYLTEGSPFAQRMRDDTDDLVRRIYLNVNAEYLTAY